MNGNGNEDEIAKVHRHRNKKTKSRNAKRQALLVFSCVCAVLVILIGGALVYYATSVKPPEQNSVIGAGVNSSSDSNNSSDNIGTRTEKIYTFLLVGMDDGNGNTDTIMVGKFDTKTGNLSVVSIPRDTLVNVPWDLKKVNSLYANGGIESLESGLKDILGFDLDFYVRVDLDAFTVLIDAVGGVWFDVPHDMELNGTSVSKGYQLLDGEHAIVVARTRNVYAEADIARIQTQQQFLMAAAKQIMANKDSLNIQTLANVFLNYVDTDLTYGNLIWFAQEFFKMGLNDISFATLPADYWGTVLLAGYTQATSFVCIYPDEWVEMINEKLNPFEEEIELSDLNILTKDIHGRVYSTSGYYAGDSSWGNTGGNSSSGNSSSSGGETSSHSSSNASSDTEHDSSTSNSSSDNSASSSHEPPASSSEPENSSSITPPESSNLDSSSAEGSDGSTEPSSGDTKK